MKTLEPFQIIGANFLAANFHAALGDQRGLGKTVQAIHAAALINAQTILVTCPASVRSSWFEHVEEHFGHTQGWDIISYNGASDAKHQSSLKKYDVWIGDEAHFCKNVGSKRTLAIYGKQGLARRATWKWLLSGTFAPNFRPVELYPMLKTLHPKFSDISFAGYTQKYCGAFFDGFGWNVKGASNIDELALILDGFILRRTKREVYPNQKEPLISRIPIELSPTDLTAVIGEENAIGGRESRLSSRFDNFSQMGDTSKLLRLLGEAKVPHVIRFVDDLLETERKVAIFFRHLSVGDKLQEHFADRGYQPCVYRGGMSDKEKDGAVAAFNELKGCRVFLGQQNAAGTGINGLQTVCSTAVLAEPPWVPGETDQIIGRLDRMGQQDELVTAYVLYAKGTLDAVVTQVHDRKERVGERLMKDPFLFSDLL